MNEIKKTLQTLKARWPEAALIIIIPLLWKLSPRLVELLQLKSIRTINRIILPVCWLLILIVTLIRCGFLRTLYLEGSKRQSVPALLRIGAHFLWRMFILSLIYSLPLILLSFAFHQLLFRYINLDNPSSSQISFWFNALYPVVVKLVLIKLILLIPALIIVLDCSIIDSFKFTRRYKLLKAKELVLLYLVNIVIGLLLPLYYWNRGCGYSCCSPMTSSQHFLRFAFSTVTQFINLMTAVMAVKFVASANLANDNSSASSDIENLQNSQNMDLKE